MTRAVFDQVTFDACAFDGGVIVEPLATIRAAAADWRPRVVGYTLGRTKRGYTLGMSQDGYGPGERRE